uniref:Putative ovule protein n=1 Tax=Solanum chacoense TaxID=4108 RepID=A0A0V0GSD5_SOLCH
MYYHYIIKKKPIIGYIDLQLHRTTISYSFVSIYVIHFEFRDSNNSIFDLKFFIYLLNILDCQLL